MVEEMEWYDKILVAALIIGAINWGIYGITRLLGNGFDLVTWIFSWEPRLGHLVFVIVGLCGLFSLAIFPWRS